MTIEILRLLLDFGLTVLIWMVQLIVYPSFLHYSETELVRWHAQYTGRIALIVIPLMLGQLLIVGWQLFNEPSLYSGISFSVVLFLWGFTFSHFAPIHGKISASKYNLGMLKQLITRNWMRTALWSSLFVYGVFETVR